MTSRHPTRPDLLIAVATAFSLLGDQFLYAVLPTYYEELGLLPYQVGLLLSLNRWIRILTNHVAERLTRTWSPTWLLGISLALGALLTVVYGTVSLFPILVVARLLWGACWSFIRQIGLMTVVDSSPQFQIGQRMGIYSGISRSGSFFGNLVGAVGHDLIGFTMTLLCFALLSLLAVPIGIVARQGLAGNRKRVDAQASGDSRGTGCNLFLSATIVGTVGSGLIMSTLGLILKEAGGSTITFGSVAIGVATLNGLLLSTRWLADGLGAPILGKLSDGLGRRSTAFLLFSVGALVLLAGTYASAISSLILIVVLFFVAGAGATVITMTEAGTRGSRALALTMTGVDLGAAFGPILGWSLKQVDLPTSTIFLFGGILYLIAALLTPWTFRTPEVANLYDPIGS